MRLIVYTLPIEFNLNDEARIIELEQSFTRKSPRWQPTTDVGVMVGTIGGIAIKLRKPRNVR